MELGSQNDQMMSRPLTAVERHDHVGTCPGSEEGEEEEEEEEEEQEEEEAEEAEEEEEEERG